MARPLKHIDTSSFTTQQDKKRKDRTVDNVWLALTFKNVATIPLQISLEMKNTI